MKKSRNKVLERIEIKLLLILGIFLFFSGIFFVLLGLGFGWGFIVIGALCFLFREDSKITLEELNEEEQQEASAKAELEKRQLDAHKSLKRIQENLKRMEEESARKREKEEIDFVQALDEIPLVPISISESAAPQSDISGLMDLKFSNVTKKTSRQKLGNFVVIDIETTGLSPAKDEILEIAAIRYINFSPMEKFVTLTSPSKHIPTSATRINGISDVMVEGFPHFKYIAKSLEDFLGKDNIVGHNLEFDLSFIVRNGVNVFSCNRKYYDTLEIARRTLKKAKKKWNPDLREYEIDYDCDYDVENHKLGTLCAHYCIPYFGSHRALADCYATASLFNWLELVRR